MSSQASLFQWYTLLSNGDFRPLSPWWWCDYIAAEFEKEPAHVLVEVACFAIIFLLLFRRPSKIQGEKLTQREEEELIAEWKPVPLCPSVEDSKTRVVVTSVTGPVVQAVVKGRAVTLQNFTSANFIGLANSNTAKQACRDTIDKYGVGSCGPRGFYGSFDLHLLLEQTLSTFLSAQECIIYSDSIACISSVVPAFCKRGDLVLCPDSANFAINQGCLLSRSRIVYFKHNDVKDLEDKLKMIEAEDKKKRNAHINRRFIVVESISQHYGDICPLPEIVRLKNQYKYRLMVDDSLGIGVLGGTGRGVLEHFNLRLTHDVEVLCGALDQAIGSVGGFCVGEHQIVDHQRLSGAGYCFSASAPPYCSQAAICAIDALIESKGELSKKARNNAKYLRKALKRPVWTIDGSDESPVLHIRMKNHSATFSSEEASFYDAIYETLLAQNIAVQSPEYIPAERNPPPASIKVLVTAQHSEADMDKLVKALTKAWDECKA